MWFELQQVSNGKAFLWMLAVSEAATPSEVVDVAGGVTGSIAHHYAESGMSVAEIAAKIGHTAQLVRSDGPPSDAAAG